jgi:hypothetical protein
MVPLRSVNGIAMKPTVEPSLDSNADGDNNLLRAAASSRANGSPSNRRQTAATSAAFSGVTANPGRTIPACSQNICTAADACPAD